MACKGSCLGREGQWFNTLKQYFEAFPAGSSVQYRNQQGVWTVRALGVGEQQDLGIEWAPHRGGTSAGTGAMRSVMGGVTGEGDQARFVMEGGHRVELSFDQAAQAIYIEVDRFYTKFYPAVVPKAADYM